MHIKEDFTLQSKFKNIYELKRKLKFVIRIYFPLSSSKVNFIGEKNKFQNIHRGNKRKYNDFSNNSSNNNKYKKNKTCYNCGKKKYLKHENRNKEAKGGHKKFPIV